MEQAQVVLQELEAAARVMLVSIFLLSLIRNVLFNLSFIGKASPSLVSHEQRSAAERVFMNFRKTNMPYSICRYILGKN